MRCCAPRNSPRIAKPAYTVGGGARSPLKLAQLKTLRDAFALVPDPRRSQSRRHPLGASMMPAEGECLGWAAREHWSVENKNHHKRDHHVWQEDRHRHRRVNIAQKLSLTRNALPAVIQFDEKNNLPTLIVDYQDRKQLAIDLILKAKPFP